MLDKNRVKAIESYRHLMCQQEDTDYDKLPTVGDEAYQILCSSRNQTKERKRLDEILIETGVSIEDYKLIKTGSRKRSLTEYKTKYAIRAFENYYTLSEIGENIGVSDSAIKLLIDKHR